MGKGYAVHFVRDETGCYRAWEIACELGPHRREMKTVTRDALPELLRKEGHEIVTAGNGQEPMELPTPVRAALWRQWTSPASSHIRCVAGSYGNSLDLLIAGNG